MDLLVLAGGLGSRFGGLKQAEAIDNNGNFIPIMARPSATWDTFGLLYERVDLDKYYLRTKGPTTQSYQITWIISRNFDI